MSVLQRLEKSAVGVELVCSWHVGYLVWRVPGSMEKLGWARHRKDWSNCRGLKIICWCMCRWFVGPIRGYERSMFP